MNTLPNELTSIIYEYSKKKNKELTDNERWDFIEDIIRKAFTEYFNNHFDKTQLIDFDNSNEEEIEEFNEGFSDTLTDFIDFFLEETFNNHYVLDEVKDFHNTKDLSWFLFFIKIIKLYDEDFGNCFTEYNKVDKVVNLAFYYLARQVEIDCEFDLHTQTFLQPLKTDLRFNTTWKNLS